MTLIEENTNLLWADADIIAHQTNCCGVMGAGVAKQIKRGFPDVFEAYSKLCSEKTPEELLGTCFISGRVANLFGQTTFGVQYRKTDYVALYKALIDLKKQMEALCLKTVAFPYKIGCGLAGGDWEIVYKLIERVFTDTDFTVKICKL